MVSRLVVCLILAATAACTSSPDETANRASDPTTTSTTAAPDPWHDRGPDEVLIRLGDINLGNNIDGFVSTSDVVVYGDGRAYAYLYDDAVGEFRPTTKRLTEDQLRTLLRTAAQLSAESPPRLQGADDHMPFRISVNGRLWITNNVVVDNAPLDPIERPILELADEIRDAVLEGAIEWTPAAWIERVPPAETCRVVTAASAAWNYRAPVYPHLESRFPLGDLSC